MTWLLLALLGVAEADDNTYCVGGYTGRPPNVVAACAAPSVRRKHRKWHFHAWFRRGNECFACYDEVDNSCISDFLRDHPRYRKMLNPYDCAQQNTGDKIVSHVIQGRDITPPRPTPRPPKPIKTPTPTPAPRDDAKARTPTPTPTPRPTPRPEVFQAKLDSVSPGPYAAGDTVTLRGSVRDPDGDPALIGGGTFRVTGADGTTTDVAGVLQPDGTVSAQLTLPATAGLDVAFVPQSPTLQPHQSLARADSAPQRLTIDTCAFRARVTSPVSGAALAVDQQARFAVELTRPDGTVAPLPADLALTFTVTRPDADALTLTAGASGETRWTPDAAWTDVSFEVVAGGSAGTRTVCPQGPVSATVTSLGLGWDTSALPERCYATLPCEGDAVLVRPTGSARQRVDALLADPATTVTLYDGPKVVRTGPPSPDDRYTFQTSYADIQHGAWRLVVQGASGDVELPLHEVDVRPPLKLQLPDVLDLGTVPAGTAFTEACAGLDFSASQAAQEHQWRVVARGLEDCASTPVLAFANLFGLADKVSLATDVTVNALDPDRPILDICLDVPACAADASADGTHLVVVPLTPEFADQERRVKLTWVVTDPGLLGCHGWWLFPLLGLLLVAIVVYGFVWPHRFPGHAAIRVAGSANALRRQSAIGLVGLPGSGSGWYRHARLGLMPSGEVRRDLRGAAIVLRAAKGGLVLEAIGPLETRNRRSGKWDPVEDRESHSPDPSTVYRTGDVVFRVEV